MLPIPTSALDDRLGFIGTSGSGKTYNAGGAVERLLEKKARVVIIDPLGVWWGLRLSADGKHPSPFQVAIFGGPRGDLPLNEHAGALIGETAATMAESCIIDLRELGSKAAERRFMTTFLDTIYRKAGGEPFHLIVDEADLFAPQKPSSGDETLLGLMENIVRRGRVKGFIPWLISQRPAVLNKNVLSQVDGLIAFKLTATQDRDALDAWIEGQADKVKGKEIKDELPAMQIGQGVVWLPGHGILKKAQFPPKITFDSSRAPKRGEKQKHTASLKPLDLGMLKERLATVVAETKANDPKALRLELSRVTAELNKLKAAPAKAAPNKDAISAAEQRGFEQAKKKFGPACEKALNKAIAGMMTIMGQRLHMSVRDIEEDSKAMRATIPGLDAEVSFTPPAPAPQQPGRPVQQMPPIAKGITMPNNNNADGPITGPQRQLLQSLAWWRGMGHEQPTRVQVASICGWRITSGHLKNVSGSLKTRGLIDYPSVGTMALTNEGAALAPPPDTSTTLEESVRAILTGPQRQAFDVLSADGRAMSREQLAQACGWNITSGHVKNVLGSMRSLEVIDYPSQGNVARADWLRMRAPA